MAARVGPNLVVPYVPGSVEDLCLLWNLRAANGWGVVPLGVPTTENVVEVVRGWRKAGAGYGHLNPGRTPGNALVSASVDPDQLREWAGELGDRWTTTTVEEVLLAGDLSFRRSTEVVTFDSGSARVFGWSQDDVARLGRNLGLHSGLGTRARIRPLVQKLPPSPSLGVESYSGGVWRGGAFEALVTDLDKPLQVSWPVGWTVLEAMARDRGLAVRRSEAGKAAEALVRRVGSLDDTFLLSHPDLLPVLYRLSERAGAPFFKSKVGPLIAEVREALDTTHRADALQAQLESIAASASDASHHSISADRMPPSLGSRVEVGQWLEWAEAAGVLLRGVEVRCPTCGHNQWSSLSELAPPLICRGCADPIERPFRHDILQFRYRASETLLAVMDFDALGHVLVLRWLGQLFQRGFERPEVLVGGHPGVEVLDSSGAVIGEVDVLLLFSDGEIALGEYKRSPSSLNEDELAKLDRVAEAMGAGWTFLATHGSAADCPEIWTECQRGLPHPRLALAGDHLYAHAIWTMGSNPFAWPGSDGDETGIRRVAPVARTPAQIAATLASFHRPDAALHDAWEQEDRRAAAERDAATAASDGNTNRDATSDSPTGDSA